MYKPLEITSDEVRLRLFFTRTGIPTFGTTTVRILHERVDSPYRYHEYKLLSIMQHGTCKKYLKINGVFFHKRSSICCNAVNVNTFKHANCISCP